MAMAAGFEGAVGFGQNAGGVGEVVQYHAGDSAVGFAVGHGQVLQIAQAKIGATDLGIGILARQLQHGGRGIYGDYLIGLF